MGEGDGDDGPAERPQHPLCWGKRREAIEKSGHTTTAVTLEESACPADRGGRGPSSRALKASSGLTGLRCRHHCTCPRAVRVPRGVLAFGAAGGNFLKWQVDPLTQQGRKRASSNSDVGQKWGRGDLLLVVLAQGPGWSQSCAQMSSFDSQLSRTSPSPLASFCCWTRWGHFYPLTF